MRWSENAYVLGERAKTWHIARFYSGNYTVCWCGRQWPETRVVEMRQDPPTEGRVCVHCVYAASTHGAI